MNRPVILTFAEHYLPGFKAGGPIRTLKNMADQLSDEFDFRIVAADRDLGDTTAFACVELDAWTTVGQARVFYRSPGARGWKSLLASLEEFHFDLIYLNSFFGSGAALRPLLYRRLGRIAPRSVLLAPRGEFSPGALALKPIKKRLFINVARALGVYRGVIFQASSEHEAADINRVLGSVPVLTALDMSGRSSTSLIARPVVGYEPLRPVFLSRISPKKNLLGAIEMLSKVSTPATLDIYGIIEDNIYWERCQAAIASLPSHVQARYQRALHPDEVEGVLANHDFLFLPTFGENYGHVIREALSAGLPVLISDQTPWRDLAVQNVGGDFSLDAPESFVAWIENFARLDGPRRAAMRQAARAKGDDHEAAEIHREANRRMLYAALHSTTA